MSAEPARDVRGANLATDDPLRGEWDVIVISPHFAGAIVARELVARAAAPLLRRIVPAF